MLQCGIYRLRIDTRLFSPLLFSPLLSPNSARCGSALQESPEVVPTGEMPRNIIVVLDRNLVDKVSPGTRVSIMGIASLYNSAAAKKQVGGVAIRTPFMQVNYFVAKCVNSNVADCK